jgi:hypothetical protein
MAGFGRLMMLLGFVLFLGGALIYLLSRTGIQVGRLPGNIQIERGNFTCVIALGASILLSILLTVLLNIVVRVINK